MPSLAKLLLFALPLNAVEPSFHFHVAGEDPGPWPAIFGSIGMTAGTSGVASVIVLPAGTPAASAIWRPRVEQGTIVVLEGHSEFAASLGFAPAGKSIQTRQIRDLQDETLPIIWERALDLPVYTVPSAAKVFSRERWSGAPMAAGLRIGRGAVFWLNVTPGQKGHERFPYILQALTSLGLEAPFRSGRLWAFFDSSYRLRADPDYLAERWRAAGIGALHVAAWHYYDADPQRDEYLHKLIDAAHRRAILVYAWVELPHVSEKFWNDHPEWREKTALLQDAQLDWRKLMNLANPACVREVKAGIAVLAKRFNWDGINLAELYFESLEGIANPSRFTPFNEDVRAEFRALHNADPVAVARDAAHPLRPKLLEFRASLAQRIQEDWLNELSQIRRTLPHLDVVLTHVDDKFDTRMRDAIGAESSRLLPQLARHDFTFLIEDPATIWHLGPQRYPQIAGKYNTPYPEKLAIDINIVERYQDVYPTKQQTGTELFQLVSLSSRAFPRVALYFENSIHKADLPLLSSSAARVDRIDHIAGRLVMDSKYGAGIPWTGSAKINGRLWPVAGSDTLWLPPGPVAIEPSPAAPPLRILDFNGDLKTASAQSNAIDISYNSPHRAIAIADRMPAAVEIDGAPVPVEWMSANGRHALLLPRGQHVVSFLLTAPGPLKEVSSPAPSGAAKPQSSPRGQLPLP
ncbi:MAG: hypothetical protein HYX27_18230 [Acidobacteria bacterium]|nr:hypothetical protein [Acidobacteriota bacterium]